MKKASPILFIILFGLFGFNSLKPKNQQPNIVLIFMDDLGFGDIGVNGALQYSTPNIDRMAAEGMRFTNFLSAQAGCSAPGAALVERKIHEINMISSNINRLIINKLTEIMADSMVP